MDLKKTYIYSLSILYDRKNLFSSRGFDWTKLFQSADNEASGSEEQAEEQEDMEEGSDNENDDAAADEGKSGPFAEMDDSFANEVGILWTVFIFCDFLLFILFLNSLCRHTSLYRVRYPVFATNSCANFYKFQILFAMDYFQLRQRQLEKSNGGEVESNGFSFLASLGRATVEVKQTAIPDLFKVAPSWMPHPEYHISPS